MLKSNHTPSKYSYIIIFYLDGLVHGVALLPGDGLALCLVLGLVLGLGLGAAGLLLASGALLRDHGVVLSLAS